MSAFDVAIVGAGPAGSVAAHRLAVAGASVLLVDKAVFPRDKPCGGGVTGRAARLLPFSIEPVVEDVVDRLECRLGYGAAVRAPRARAARVHDAARAARPLPLQKAARAGADVRDGVKVADVRANALSVDGAEIGARIVIGADGCNGSAAKLLGLAQEIVHGVALEANYPHDVALRARDGARHRRGPRRLRLGVPEGRPRQRRRRRRRERGAEAARAPAPRCCEAHGIDPDARDGRARLSPADAHARERARARHARP